MQDKDCVNAIQPPVGMIGSTWMANWRSRERNGGSFHPLVAKCPEQTDQAREGFSAMQDKSDEVTPRHFNLMSAVGLSDEARKAVNEAFDAMSTWRIETARSSEKNSEQVIEKMAAAARALGWQNEIVDAIRAQMQGIARLQIQMMDHIMDAWEEQIKSPNPMGSFPSAMLSRLNSLPGHGPAGSASLGTAAMNPFQFWIQIAEQWQRATGDAMASWTKAGDMKDSTGKRRRG